MNTPDLQEGQSYGSRRVAGGGGGPVLTPSALGWGILPVFSTTPSHLHPLLSRHRTREARGIADSGQQLAKILRHPTSAQSPVTPGGTGTSETSATSLPVCHSAAILPSRKTQARRTRSGQACLWWRNLPGDFQEVDVETAIVTLLRCLT